MTKTGSMLSPAIFAFVIFGFTLPSFALSPIVTIQIKDHAEVSKNDVYLSDIVVPASIPQDWMDHFSSIYIGEAPQVGEVKYVQVELLKSYLRKIIEGNGQKPDQVEMIIPSEIVVTRKYMNIPKEEIEQAFKNYVIKHISWNPNNIEIHSIKYTGLPVVPAGERTINVSSESQELAGGNVSLNFQVIVDGRPSQSFNVTGVVELYDDVLLAAKNLSRGSIVQPGDISIGRAKVTDDPKGYAKKELDVVGKKILKDFEVNEPLRLSYLDNPVVINKGDIVKLVVTKPGLILTAKGEAKSDGRVGDRVKVMNISSKKIIQGWVKDKETVLVAE